MDRSKKKVRTGDGKFTGTEIIVPRDEEWMYDEIPNIKGNKNKRSYKDAVRNPAKRLNFRKKDDGEEGKDLDVEPKESESETEASEKDNAEPENPGEVRISVEKDKLDWLNFKLSERECKRLRKPFRKTLIIKLLGENPEARCLGSPTGPTFGTERKERERKEKEKATEEENEEPVQEEANNQEVSIYLETSREETWKKKEDSPVYEKEKDNRMEIDISKEDPMVMGTPVKDRTHSHRKEDPPVETQGAAGKKFSHAFKEMKINYKPNLVFSFETKCSGLKAENAIKNMGYPEKEVMEARGKGHAHTIGDFHNALLSYATQQDSKRNHQPDREIGEKLPMGKYN
ncbi:uncharacterized protein G2W53_026386 [Senna tora]|uniref:Uncharacterized protein n=1 Tax=Senna tora TaxID=362788 RepID=A0A834TH31_9FABA|nr:uncharacterized protein G2W53_026386 [Senna tora]